MHSLYDDDILICYNIIGLYIRHWGNRNDLCCAHGFSKRVYAKYMDAMLTIRDSICHPQFICWISRVSIIWFSSAPVHCCTNFYIQFVKTFISVFFCYQQQSTCNFPNWNIILLDKFYFLENQFDVDLIDNFVLLNFVADFMGLHRTSQQGHQSTLVSLWILFIFFSTHFQHEHKFFCINFYLRILKMFSIFISNFFYKKLFIYETWEAL